MERKAELVERGEIATASDAVAIVCGMDAATVDRYEARNDALRSIARRRDLEKDDVAALMAYLRRADDAMRIERVAALKNDVMNLLRNPGPAGGRIGGDVDCDDRGKTRCRSAKGTEPIYTVALIQCSEYGIKAP